jgi:hypothetical protein
MEDYYNRAPEVMLENYMGFLATLGCTLIFSNDKIFAVPSNSVLKKTGGAPGKGQLQKYPNAAGPADYVSYHYRDNGYRDVAGVIVTVPNYIGGQSAGSWGFERGTSAFFMEKKGLSQASGVYVAEAHPWMAISSFATRPGDSASAASRMDKSGDSMYKTKKTFGDSLEAAQKGAAEKVKKKKESSEDYLKNTMQNYAETKFYQVRFGDRQGSITLDFNPQWVPGTGGTLYVRDTQQTLTFYVLSVTHHIDMTAPNSGSAITTVSYCCGRLGKESIGSEEDSFLGYNSGKESAVQNSFLQDIGAGK